MNEAELAEQLAVLLGEELADRIPELDRVLIALEREPAEIALRHELQRLLHVVKGASRSAGKVDIEAAAHDLETHLATVAEGSAVPSATIELALQFAQQLEVARTLLTGGPPTAAPVVEEAEASVRVTADDLDLMMEHSAAILVARQGLVDPMQLLGELQADLAVSPKLSPGQLAAVSVKLADVYRALARSVTSLASASTLLDSQVRRSRLRSILDACRGCERLVHDAAAAMGKAAELVVRGGEVRVDRAQIQTLRDVLIQLLRNSIAHGIELPEARHRAGKPERGLVSIDATVVGDAVRVSVTDDGVGLDLAAIGERATRSGVRIETPADAAHAIFAHGLSTAAAVTEMSGRGVGLDVAKQRIELMHGSIGVETVRGHSTTFTIELPTTVATITALVVMAEGVSYALPSSTVERVVRIDRAALRHVDARTLVRVGTDWLTIGTLAHVLGAIPHVPQRSVAMILTQAGRRVAVHVDAVVGMVELAVGSLDVRLGRLRHLTGQVRLPNGTIALVLNASDVIEDVLGMQILAPVPASATKPTRRKILVADDSATTRALESNILRTAGYDVTVAVDGEAALRTISAGQFDLLVSDVDMPNLDGFGLTQAVRAIERFATLPIILITARGTDADRAKGMRVGASAYLVKSSFDQTVLLQTIERLL